MRIVQANLCLRFYRQDGWTREAVRLLLREDKQLSRVIPRYYDDRDRELMSRTGQQPFRLDDDEPHDDCDYFAVYDVLHPFSKESLAEHDVV